MASASSPLTTVIIPTLNRVDLLKQAVTTFRKYVQTSHEIVVVDNGNDGTDAWCQKNGVECLKPDEPMTFGESNNLAAAQSKAEYLLLLNNDTITDRDFLGEAIAVMEAHPRCVMVGCKIIDGDGKLSHAAVEFQPGSQIPYHPNMGDDPDQEFYNFDRPVNAVTAAAALVKRGAWRKVHGFDPCYENNYEDVDLCLKFRERGWEIWYAHKAVVTHLVNQTRGKSCDIRPMLRLFMQKWVESGNLKYMADLGKLDLHVMERRLNLGCGEKVYPGYINVDHVAFPGVNVQRDVTRGLPFDDESVDHIHASHFFEYLKRRDASFVLRELGRVLKPGGTASVRVWNGWHGGPMQEADWRFAEPLFEAVGLSVEDDPDRGKVHTYRMVKT